MAIRQPSPIRKSLALLLSAAVGCGSTKNDRPEDVIWNEPNPKYPAIANPGTEMPVVRNFRKGGDPTPLPGLALEGPPKPVEPLTADPVIAKLGPEAGDPTSGGNTQPPPGGAVPAGYTPHPIVQALEAYMQERPQQAVECLSGYKKEDQELLLQLLPIVAKVDKEGILASKLSGDELLHLIEVFRSCLGRLQKSAPLQIGKLVFCQRIYSFGAYQPLARNQFRPGDCPHLYVEVQNLADAPETDSLAATRLSYTLEIRNSLGEVAWKEEGERGSATRTPRSDHYRDIWFTMPDLPPGFYTLRVCLIDKATQRQAAKTIDFRLETMTASKVERN